MQDKTLQPYFLLALIGGSFLLGFYILQPFLAPLVLAVIFAVVLQPVYRRLRLVLRGRSSLASIATVLLFAIVILVPATFVGSRLLIEARQLYASVSQEGALAAFGNVLDVASTAISDVVPDASSRIDQLKADIGIYTERGLNWLIEHLGTAFSSVLGVFLDIFIFFIALYYLLRDGHILADKLVELSPLSDTDDAAILEKLATAINSVIKGQLAVAIIQGTLSGIGLAIFGVPNPVLWGVVAAMAAFIPSLGTSLILVPATAYLALSGSIGAAIGLGIWAATAVGLVDNMLGPRLMSAGLHLHPLLVILAVIGGLALFGPIGLFLGPLTMSLLIVLLSIYRDITRRSVENGV